MSPARFKLCFGLGALLIGILGGLLRWRKLKKGKHPLALEILTEILQPDIFASAMLIVVGAIAVFFSLREMTPGR